MFGTILVVDLRILGIASTERPFSRVSGDMLKWTWAAFALAALTGSLMFITNARVYWDNTFFRVKMLLILLAGVNMLVFQATVGRSREWDRERRAPALGLICGVTSMTVWVLVIAMGRTIGFTTTGVAAKEAKVAPNIDFDSFLGADTGSSDSGGAPPAAGSTAAAASRATTVSTTGTAPATGATVPGKAAPLSIQELMDQQVNPAGEFLFRSVRIVADDQGRRLEAPSTAAQWGDVRDKLNMLRGASDLLNAPDIKAAPPGFRAENPGVESEPAEIQTSVDSNRADFNAHAARLKAAADVAMKSADAQNPQALMKALDGIDKACESCHLRYFYPRDKRAQQQAKEDGVD